MMPLNDAPQLFALVQTRLAFAQPYWLLLLLLLPVLAWLKGKHGRQAAFLFLLLRIPFLLGNRLFGFHNRVIELKKTLDPSDFKRLSDSLIHSHQPQTALLLLTIDMRSHQGANRR